MNYVLNNVYNVQCTPYHVLCAMTNVLRTLHHVRCTMYSVGRRLDRRAPAVPLRWRSTRAGLCGVAWTRPPASLAPRARGPGPRGTAPPPCARQSASPPARPPARHPARTDTVSSFGNGYPSLVCLSNPIQGVLNNHQFQARLADSQ